MNGRGKRLVIYKRVMPIPGWASWQTPYCFFYIYSTKVLFLQGGKERGFQIAELRRLMSSKQPSTATLPSTPHGVEVADGGLTPPQPSLG